MARKNRTLPKTMRHKPTLDELEELETADWQHDLEMREQKQALKFKRAENREKKIVISNGKHKKKR